ncbi:MAG TPA: PilX N-terminal domain-containing pilus assembly protein [Nitrospiraceae bacterium]|jgi:Tfp pilus assembly protein PilX|nr:PilX N-terminal domain-containing pilus assembly protein [Nitrospiraceae bacterium]
MTKTERGFTGNQRGVAFLTVMLLLLILTVIGVAAVTVSGLENRIAGLARTSEAASSAAESCLGTAVNIIQQTIDQGSLPATFLSNATPAGPVPQTNATVLNQEILGQSDNNPDVADGTGAVPNLVQTVGAYTVNGDIDRLYAKAKAGSGMQMFGGYEGTAGGSSAGGVDILYRVNCVARNAATGASSRITAIYACTMTGESCQKQL